MSTPTSVSHRWSEDRIARELESWFAACTFDYWPTYRTFVDHGRKSVYAALIRSGGAARWALELGVPIVKHRPGRRLTDSMIEDALRDVLREHRPARFPTSTWLTRHGPPGLAAAVKRTGGGAHGARVLHMPAPQPARWTDGLIEAELRRVCAGSTRWPSRAEFERAGATGVLRAVYRGYGSRWWANRLGLSTESLRARRRNSPVTGAGGSPGRGREVASRREDEAPVRRSSRHTKS